MSLASRLTRRAPRGTSADAPRLCVVGFGRVDDPMLPRWVAHHAGQVGGTALLLLLWGRREGDAPPVTGCATHVLPAGSEPDEERGRRMAARFAEGLLSAYDLAATLPLDALLLADPAVAPDLPSLLARRPGAETLRGTVLELLTSPEAVAGDAPLLGADARLVRPGQDAGALVTAAPETGEDRRRTGAGQVRTLDGLLLLRVATGPAPDGSPGGPLGEPVPAALVGAV